MPWGCPSLGWAWAGASLCGCCAVGGVCILCRSVVPVVVVRGVSCGVDKCHCRGLVCLAWCCLPRYCGCAFKGALMGLLASCCVCGICVSAGAFKCLYMGLYGRVCGRAYYCGRVWTGLVNGGLDFGCGLDLLDGASVRKVLICWCVEVPITNENKTTTHYYACHWHIQLIVDELFSPLLSIFLMPSIVSVSITLSKA